MTEQSIPRFSEAPPLNLVLFSYISFQHLHTYTFLKKSLPGAEFAPYFASGG